MPVVRADDQPNFDLGGNTITGFASPSRGAAECILYRVEMPPSGTLPAHRHDHQEVFNVAAGSGTMFIDDEVHPIGPGDSVVVPTGALHRLEAAADGAAMVVTMLAGTRFIREDGSESVPPWGE
ncbi:MAG: cupin domain-containing protein [Actinomycetota bacterium]